MDKEIPEIIRDAYKSLPHFKDGRIDYSDAEKAPVVVVFLKYGDEILILKRSDRVGTHQGRWGTVAGYLDELKPVVEKAFEEIEEETGIGREKIAKVLKNGVYEFRSESEDICYTAHLVLAVLKERTDVKLSWEHTDYKWVKISNSDRYLSHNASEELKKVLYSLGK